MMLGIYLLHIIMQKQVFPAAILDFGGHIGFFSLNDGYTFRVHLIGYHNVQYIDLYVFKNLEYENDTYRCIKWPEIIQNGARNKITTFQ